MTSLKNVFLSNYTLHQLQLLTQAKKIKRELLITAFLQEYLHGSAYAHYYDNATESYVQNNLSPYRLLPIPENAQFKQVKFFVRNDDWQALTIEARRKGYKLHEFVDRVLYLVASNHNNPRPLKLDELYKLK